MPGDMQLLTSAPNVFAARVVAARLGSEGIVWQLRGNVDGPYPIGVVQVLVATADLADARELLLADEIESAFDTESDEGDETAEPLPRSALRAPLTLWLVLGAILAVSISNLTRLLL